MEHYAHPTSFRTTLERWIESRAGKFVLLSLILLGALVIGLETDPQIEAEDAAVLHGIDSAILAIFTLEIAVRAYVAGSVRGYLKDPWNVFDLLVVGSCYISDAGTFLVVGRLVRVLRLLRLVTIYPSLRRLIEALVRSVPAMGHILGLLLLVQYVYAVIGVFAFRDFMPEQFGDLRLSAFSLFRVTTLDGGLDIMFSAMKQNPFAWVYFVSYIVFVAFIVVNLFVGVIVDSMSETRQQERPDPNAAILGELAAIRRTLDLHARVGVNENA